MNKDTFEQTMHKEAAPDWINSIGEQFSKNPDLAWGLGGAAVGGLAGAALNRKNRLLGAGMGALAGGPLAYMLSNYYQGKKRNETPVVPGGAPTAAIAGGENASEMGLQSTRDAFDQEAENKRKQFASAVKADRFSGVKDGDPDPYTGDPDTQDMGKLMELGVKGAFPISEVPTVDTWKRLAQEEQEVDNRVVEQQQKQQQDGLQDTNPDFPTTPDFPSTEEGGGSPHSPRMTREEFEQKMSEAQNEHPIANMIAGNKTDFDARGKQLIKGGVGTLGAAVALKGGNMVKDHLDMKASQRFYDQQQALLTYPERTSYSRFLRERKDGLEGMLRPNEPPEIKQMIKNSMKALENTSNNYEIDEMASKFGYQIAGAQRAHREQQAAAASAAAKLAKAGGPDVKVQPKAQALSADPVIPRGPTGEVKAPGGPLKNESGAAPTSLPVLKAERIAQLTREIPDSTNVGAVLRRKMMEKIIKNAKTAREVEEIFHQR